MFNTVGRTIEWRIKLFLLIVFLTGGSLPSCSEGVLLLPEIRTGMRLAELGFSSAPACPIWKSSKNVTLPSSWYISETVQEDISAEELFNSGEEVSRLFTLSYFKKEELSELCTYFSSLNVPRCLTCYKHFPVYPWLCLRNWSSCSAGTGPVGSLSGQCHGAHGHNWREGKL